jgi:AcrR family transcriptional regulator
MTMRDRLFDEGIQILSRDGLAGVTIGRLAAAADCSKSGLFAHFKSKQQLQIELLDAAAAIARAHVVVPTEATPSGLPRLTELVNRWLGWSRSAGLAGGCPVAAALFELDDLDGPVREHVMALESEWRKVLRTLVEDAIAEGHFWRGVDSEQVSWELCGIYLAHHASSRFLRDKTADQRAHFAVAALFNRAAEPPASTHVKKATI